MEVNINQLMDMTGKSFRTIKARLLNEKIDVVRSDGRSDFYDSAKALEALYNLSEKARESLLHAKAVREKAEIEVGKLRGELLPVDMVAKTLGNQLSNFRAQIRAIPSKLAKPLSLISDPHEVHSQLSLAIEEFLSELTADADYQLEADRIESSRPSVVQDSEGELQANPETESSRVGGPETPPEPGVE